MTNNYDILDKLTLGTSEVEQITVTVDGEDIPVNLRPLSSGELTKLRKIEKKPFTLRMNMKNNGKIDKVKKEATKQSMDVGMADFTNAETETLYSAVAWSMDIKVDEVRTFKVGVPEEIFKHVIRISHLPDDLEVVKQFRD